MATLYDIYKSQGKALPTTVEARFADPSFASAATQAGITKDQYQINSGNADYNTRIAALYGKTPVNTGTPADTTGTGVTETIGSAFNFSNPAVNETNPIVSQYNTYNEKLARGEDIVDTEAIRRQKLADVQDRINALNQVYAGELARVKQVGQGNVGSGTAILASRGLAGSMRGEAIRTGITDQNLRAEQAVEAERNAAIQSILMDVNSSAQEEARLRKESMLAGGKAYIENLKGTEERKAGYTSNVVAQLISQGIDPKTMSPEELNSIASQLGVKSNDIIAKYNLAKYEKYEKEKKEKTNMFDLAEGQAQYRINPDTGEVELLAERGKTYAPKAAGGSGGGYGLPDISKEAQDIINIMNVRGGTVDDYIKGTSNAAQKLRSEVFSGISAQGGNTQNNIDLLQEAKTVIDDMIQEKDWKQFGYSSQLGGKFLTSYGDMQMRAKQVNAILARDNLGLLKGAMSDKDLAFIEAMSGGIGEGTISESYAKERMESIQTKLLEKLGASQSTGNQGGNNEADPLGLGI